MSAIKTAKIYVKLHLREKKLWREVKKVERQNKRMFDDNLIVRPTQQQLYAKKQALCGEVAATLMAEANVLGFDL